MTTIYTPRQEYNLTGADLTGNSGDLNRTYTLKYSPAGDQINVYVQAVKYTRNVDFTFNGTVVTFLVSIDNFMSIAIDYFTSAAITSLIYSGSLKYSNTLQLAAVLNITGNVPDWSMGTTPSPELVGTGDNSTTVFYLDYKNILGTSYTLYKGASATTLTALTETTHYSLDRDKGKITLTSAGVTFLSTNNLYAEYSYTTNNLKESFLGDTLSRAENEVDKMLNTTFTNGLVINPEYPALAEEAHDSQGLFNRTYFTLKRPLIDLGTLLDTGISSTDNTLTVTSGDGAKFPIAGRLIIENEIISYTGITGDTFTGLSRGLSDSTAVAHSAGAEIYSTVIEISATQEGGTPTWYPLKRKQDVEFDSDNGKIYIYGNSILTNYLVINGVLPKQDVMNRFRVTYLYGWDSIPTDITRLTLLVAQKMLFTDTVMSSLVKGRNEFRPEILDNVKAEIDQISDSYRNLDIQNT